MFDTVFIPFNRGRLFFFNTCGRPLFDLYLINQGQQIFYFQSKVFYGPFLDFIIGLGDENVKLDRKSVV